MKGWICRCNGDRGRTEMKARSERRREEEVERRSGLSQGKLNQIIALRTITISRHSTSQHTRQQNTKTHTRIPRDITVDEHNAHIQTYSQRQSCQHTNARAVQHVNRQTHAYIQKDVNIRRRVQTALHYAKHLWQHYHSRVYINSIKYLSIYINNRPIYTERDPIQKYLYIQAYATCCDCSYT